jgi:hypothetical protein
LGNWPNILTKATALRINLYLDGAPITSQSHTHPSHSQTSRHRDEVNRREVCECDGWVCDLDMMGAPSKLSVIRKPAVSARARSTLFLSWSEKTARRKWNWPRSVCASWTPEDTKKIFKVPYSKNFLLWHCYLFVPEQKSSRSYSRFLQNYCSVFVPGRSTCGTKTQRVGLYRTCTVLVPKLNNNSDSKSKSPKKTRLQKSVVWSAGNNFMSRIP